jgi:dienelactone hydrolase
MKTQSYFNVGVLLFALLLVSSVTPVKLMASLHEETITYKVGDNNYKAFVVFDQSIKARRPAILVVHEWWGLNDYTRMRARKLAELGYIAMAVDLFGDGKNAANPKEAQELTMPYYKNPELIKTMLDAAIGKIKEYSETNINNICAIGYCFGGYVVLNAAKLGADLNAVVSFHGGLGGVPLDKKLLKAKILACHGAADKIVTQEDVSKFKHQMDSIGADYVFKTYPNATHAFTNPDATRLGEQFSIPIAYNADADKASWDDMKVFLAGISGKKP